MVLLTAQPGPYFQNLRRRKKVLRNKTKIVKTINFKIYLLVYGQKLIFNLGIPLQMSAKKDLD